MSLSRVGTYLLVLLSVSAAFFLSRSSEVGGFNFPTLLFHVFLTSLVAMFCSLSSQSNNLRLLMLILLADAFSAVVGLLKIDLLLLLPAITTFGAVYRELYTRPALKLATPNR